MRSALPLKSDRPKLETRLAEILRSGPVMREALRRAAQLDLPDWKIVSGAVYNTVWNALTGRPSGYGIKDIDLFYFDPDTSWDAEDREIKRAAGIFSPEPPVEVRNQARVHLWYEDRFGYAIPPLVSTEHSIANFAAITHAVGVSLGPGESLQICAPYGLDAIFDLRMVPNPGHPNRVTYEAKVARAKEMWPEITVEPWPTEPEIRQADETSDWGEVLELLHRAFAYMEGRIDPPSSLHRLDAEALRTKAKMEICLLATYENRLAGCVFCAPSEASLYISKLAVDPDRQGQGTGRALMARAELLARQRALASLTLETRIELTENHAAFAALGFIRTGESAHPGYDRPTSTMMRKPL